VAYALAGSLKINLLEEPLGADKDGNPVYLRDIWPSNQEVRETIEKSLTPEMFRSRYSNVFEGPPEWRELRTGTDETYRWSAGSTYVKLPPYFEDMEPEPGEVTDVIGARELVILGD